MNFFEFSPTKNPVASVAVFLTWSLAMVFAGSMLSTATLQAANSTDIVRLDRERLGGENLGEFEPYEPESGDLVAKGHEYFYSDDENFGIGVWESKPGSIRYTDLEYDELMIVLQGSMIMTDQSGHSETYGEGEGLVLPKGWTGTLTVPAGGVRKIWVAYMGGKKG